LAVLCLGVIAAAGARLTPTSPQAAGTTLGGSVSGLRTALFDPYSFRSSEAPQAYAHTRDAGATAVRLSLEWRDVAPSALPVGSDPTDPANPGYDWGATDTQIQQAVAAGLDPIIFVYNPPNWAREPAGNSLPTLHDPTDVGKFFHALARRYGGSYLGLPRVYFYQVWNEPNHSDWLDPQYNPNKSTASPALYRQIVNSVADAVHSVHSDDLVVAGGLSPFGRNGQATAIPPMQFMRDFLCMSGGNKPKPTCPDVAKFDVWTHHPYTYGGPDSKPAKGDDVSIGNLPAMKKLLDQAVRAGHVQGSGPQFWVTEFSWDSNPPDPNGLPVDLEPEWISEALYLMYNDGIDLVTWFLIRDSPPGDEHFESGLYFRGTTVADDTAKPGLEAFRFPLVCNAKKKTVWGRTPPQNAGQNVVIEESDRNGSNFTATSTVQSNSDGIFTYALKRPKGKYCRARIESTGEVSVQFPEAGTRNLNIKPFG
jgi:hypothetical protein